MFVDHTLILLRQPSLNKALLNISLSGRVQPTSAPSPRLPAHTPLWLPSSAAQNWREASEGAQVRYLA